MIHCRTYIFLVFSTVPTFFILLYSIGLKKCWAMKQSNGQTCRVCGCNWEHHMHVTYELKEVNKVTEDMDAKKRYEVTMNIAKKIPLF